MPRRQTTLRVLIVDDDDAVARSLARALRRHHVHVETARGAVEALERMAGASYDAVVSDHDMAGGPSGRWLLDEVRVRFPRARRVLHSGMPREDPGSAGDPPWQVMLLKPVPLKAMLEALTGDLRRTD